MKKKIAIIGAGLTGLSAALKLAKEGYKVEVFENAPEVGGLAGSFKIEGTNIEKTYHHVFQTDYEFLKLVDELGLTDKMKWYESSVGIYYDEKLYPFVGAVDLIKFSPLPFFDRIRAGVVVLFLQKYKNWKALLPFSAYDWMKKWAGKNVLKVIWEPLLVGKFSEFAKKVSMGWLWARIHIRANSRKGAVGKEMLGYMDGGFQQIFDKLVSELKKLGVEVHLNSMVESIKSENDQVIVKIKGKEMTFDKVLAAIPSNIFSKIVTPESNEQKEYIAKTSKIDYLGAICSIFSSEQDLSRFYWHNINDVNAPFLVFINHTKLVGTENYNGKNIYYIGAYLPRDHKYFTSDEEVIRKDWFSYLKKIFPDFDQNKVNSNTIFKFKNAQHVALVGYENLIPEYKTPFENVFLGNFSQLFPEDRGMNYAISEGYKIADIINSD